jgi:hypothetical protein
MRDIVNFQLKDAKQKAIIVDLDGTVCDNNHRLDLLPPPEKAHITQAWDEFNQECLYDKPIYPMIKMVKNLQELGYVVLFLTGRSSICRSQSVKWIECHFVNMPYALFMRSVTDHRVDTAIKHDYVELLLERYDIQYAFDDKETICEVMRHQGIHAFHVGTDGGFS